MKHPDWLVAKIVGAAMVGIPHKVIAKAAEIPLATVRSMAKGERRNRIQPDDSLMYQLRQWMKL